MSNKSTEAMGAVSRASDAIRKWMYDKEDLGEDTEEFDKYGNQLGDVMVDWIETLEEIHYRMYEYAKKWGDPT